METAVPALEPIGTGERDVLPGVRPGNLVTFYLHVGDEIFTGDGVFQRLVDGLDQIQLPAVGVEAGLILTGLHSFHSGLLLWSLQNTQPMGLADFIVSLPVGQQIVGTLVEFLPVHAADAVDHQVIVDVVGVHVVAITTSKPGNSRWASSSPMALASAGVIGSSSAKDWTKW